MSTPIRLAIPLAIPFAIRFAIRSVFRLSAYAALVALSALVGCTDPDCDADSGTDCETPRPIDPNPSTEGARTRLDTSLAQSSAHFGAKLLLQLVDADFAKPSPLPTNLADLPGADTMACVMIPLRLPENLATSPLSATFALGMATLGAEGETRAEMLRALQWPELHDTELVASLNRLKNSVELADPRIQVTTANSAWLKQGFSVLDAYRYHLSVMQAEVAEVDFASPATTSRINDWVQSKTQGIIESIIAPGETLSPDLAIMLINATYFKGGWAQAFDPKATSPGEFHRHNAGQAGQAGSTFAVTVDFMRRSGANLPYLRHPLFSALALPFGAGGMEMVFIVPADSFTVLDVAKHLAISPALIDPALFDSTKVHVALPKFHIQSDLDLIPALQTLGMPMAFTDAADFSGMAETRLKIGKVKQIADVRIDESGAEAAAVTRADMVVVSAPIYPTFIADRPFLFVIRESRGLGYWLFAGAISNPAESGTH
jgi:serine protease inhibitor